ncbi:unnamed protein product, partial [Arabidopsis halleri]
INVVIVSCFRGFGLCLLWFDGSGSVLYYTRVKIKLCLDGSGSAISVAASLVAVSLGTETDGSILSPASQNSVVGITSRAGVVLISLRQDSIG